MRIKLTPELDKLTVYAEGGEQASIGGARLPSETPLEVVSFDDPVLLTDTAAIAALAPGMRDAVTSLYTSFPRTVEYDDVAVSWSPQQYPRVWCPSIDTVFIARYTKPYLTPELRAVAEIGCGSGYLTKYMLHYAPNLERAVASDINLDALRCAADAVADEPAHQILNLVRPDVDAPSLGLSGCFDLIVSNPPYLPRPNEGHDNPYEGLDLVRKLADEGKNLLTPGGKILLNLSNLSGEAPLEWFGATGWTVKIAATCDVPLKVNAVTSGLTPESHAWLEFLQTKRGLTPELKRGYDYWQTLTLYELSLS